MASDKIAWITANSASGTTVDFQSTGFGAVDGIIVIAQNGAEESDQDNVQRSVGFYDGSNYIAMCGGLEHNVGSFFTYSRVDTDKVISLYENIAGVNTITATVTAMTTDKATLSFNTHSTTCKVTVGLIQTNGGGCVVGNNTVPTTGTKDITTTGINPNCVFLAGHESTALDADGSLGTTFAFAVKDGSAGTHSNAMQYMRYTADTFTRSLTAISTAYTMCRSADNSTFSHAYKVNDFGTAKFTLEFIAGATAYVFGYMAIQFADVPRIFSGTTPTASGDWTPDSGDSQERNSYLMLLHGDSTVGTGNTAGTSGITRTTLATASYYVVDADGNEFGGSFCNEDALEIAAPNTTNCSATYSKTSSPTGNRVMTIIPETGGSPTFTAKSPTFNASGLTFSDANVDHEAAQAHAFVGIGFGAALAASTNETVYPFTGPWR